MDNKIIQQEFPGTNRQGLLLFFVTDGGKRAEFLCLFVFPHIPDISSLGNPRKQLVNAWVYGCILYTKKKKKKKFFFRFISFPAVAPLNIFFLSRENSSRNEMKIKRKQMCHFVTLAIRAE